MIEDIEGFCTEHRLFFPIDMKRLLKRHIVVIDAWARKEAAHGISNLAKWFSDEIVGIEVRSALAWIAINE